MHLLQPATVWDLAVRGGCYKPVRGMLRGHRVRMKANTMRKRTRTASDEGRGASGASQSRLPHAERRAQILDTAAQFFSENGLSGQTRRLAEACGVSQRLLYRFFPTKEELVAEVYREEILGVFKASWFVELQDRSVPVEERFFSFYQEYLQKTLTRKWLRLFLFASLTDGSMAPDYIASIITQLLEVLMREAAHEFDVTLPEDRALVLEMGWTLHGAISHYAIRKHIYKARTVVDDDRIVEMHVRMFLGGFVPMVEAQAAAD
ncbi:transcriptional regulator, TetR family [Aliiruegeria lutimaris]|uniref:Transcriptional regulator, TetR family n=2 Tax=Aliiruegeria lutimaris TaxID=571298 RepID=A0A1G8Q2M9_9RHOB|nr:transcriptional regulator, TetR family [Aliiruegeria lutimaris]